jgi:hypothetical protein
MKAPAITPIWVVYTPHKVVVDIAPMLEMIFLAFEGPESLEERVCNLIEDFILTNTKEYPNNVPEHSYLLFELRKVFNQMKKTYHEQNS